VHRLSGVGPGAKTHPRSCRPRWAGATGATVRVTRPYDQVVVEIADDGVGGADPGRGTGLRGLRDRVEALGGSLSVSDGGTGGTVVTARIPLSRP
jgi:signal transduction histidine kinase